MKFIKNVFAKFHVYFLAKHPDSLKGGVLRIMSDHAESLKKLDLYDKGEISKTKEMVNYPSVRKYVQHFQRKPGNSLTA